MSFLAQTGWRHGKKTNKSMHTPPRLLSPQAAISTSSPLCSLHTLRSLLRPMTQVGVKASDKKCDRGNQNQNWVNTRTPTTEGMWVCPVLDCSEIVTLWPPVRNHKLNKLMNAFLGTPQRHLSNASLKLLLWRGLHSRIQATMLSAFSSGTHLPLLLWSQLTQ